VEITQVFFELAIEYILKYCDKEVRKSFSKGKELEELSDQEFYSFYDIAISTVWNRLKVEISFRDIEAIKEADTEAKIYYQKY
jgi:F0F1-type ATP synthase alpha subunit